MTTINTNINTVPFRKKLTIRELRKAVKNKYLFQLEIVEDEIITLFPMGKGKCGVTLSSVYDGEHIPIFDDIKIKQLLDVVGSIGWTKLEFVGK